MASPQELALSDDLTGALNRRYLRELFEGGWDEMVREKGRVALLLLDLDSFKPVNDRHGHQAGDAVLRAVAGRLRESFRDGDRLVRYGGDEFVVVLPGAGAEEARALAERARAALEGGDWTDPETGAAVEHRVSFSIGVGAAPVDGGTGDEVLGAADRRLYEEKQARRSVRGARRARRRTLGAIAAVGAIVLVAFAIGFLTPDRPRAPEIGMPPQVGAPLADDVPTDRAELEALRAEVGRLGAALADERSAPDRERYELRIRELEATLAAAARRDAASAGAAPPSADSLAPVTSPPAVAAGAEAAAANAAGAGLEVGSRTAPGGAPPAAADDAEPVGGANRPPQLLRHEPAVYPPLALQRRLEAVVDLRVTIDPEGRVVAVESAGPTRGFGFEDAARRAALSATYRPALRNGQPFASSALLQIRFVLDRGSSRPR